MYWINDLQFTHNNYKNIQYTNTTYICREYLVLIGVKRIENTYRRPTQDMAFNAYFQMCTHLYTNV